MKKFIYIPLLALALYSCDTHTYQDIEETTVIVGNVTYNAQVKSIIDANCIVCHTTGGAAGFRPLTTYTEVKNAVQNTDLLNRIQLQNGADGIMPSTGRMSQNNINLILQWNTDGLLEN